MSKIPFESHYRVFEKWLSVRPQRDRIILLLAGYVVIYGFWHLVWQQPLQIERAHLQQEAQADKAQIAVFEAETNKVLKAAAVRAEKQQRLMAAHARTHKIATANASESDQIIKDILSTPSNVRIVSLKTNEALEMTALGNRSDGSNLELVFNSNYFDTMAYLQELEKIPWCLSWDAMEYKVMNHPDANITVTLSIVSA
jgi:hypothetical protein